MFILKKILNSPQSVPECERLKSTAGEKYICGMPLILTDDGAIRNIKSSEKPTHIACETAEPDTKAKILCHKILPEMIFSAVAYDNMSNIPAGKKLDLTMNDDSYFCLVAASSDSPTVMLVNNCGSKNYGEKVLVSFI